MGPCQKCGDTWVGNSLNSHSDLYGDDCADAGATTVVKGDIKAMVTELADNAPYD